MLYALLCTDKPNSLDLRMKVRPEHLTFLDSLGDDCKFAGPFLDEAGNPNGSLVVVKAASLADAKAIGTRDPYAIEGLFASVEVKAWRWTRNNPDAA